MDPIEKFYQMIMALNLKKEKPETVNYVRMGQTKRMRIS